MGLIGGMARTAVIAGTATAVGNRVSRRQANRWAQHDQSNYAPAQYAQPSTPTAVRTTCLRATAAPVLGPTTRTGPVRRTGTRTGPASRS